MKKQNIKRYFHISYFLKLCQLVNCILSHASCNFIPFSRVFISCAFWQMVEYWKIFLLRNFDVFQVQKSISPIYLVAVLLPNLALTFEWKFRYQLKQSQIKPGHCIASMAIGSNKLPGNHRYLDYMI